MNDYIKSLSEKIKEKNTLVYFQWELQQKAIF